jgi:dipeptidyl aminopeptidase/acylaminoacyl peptidase
MKKCLYFLFFFLMSFGEGVFMNKLAANVFWKSDITTDFILSDSVRLGEVQIDNGNIFFLEGRPSEKGRNAIVKMRDEKSKCILPVEYNARSKVHEYGGGAYTVSKDRVYFINFSDQRIYLLEKEKLTPITKEGNFSYSEMVINEKLNKLYCIREDHSQEEIKNEIVNIDLKTKKISIVATGCDFYSSIAINSDCKKMVFLQWNHPNMPWDGTELVLADIEANGSISNEKSVAGGVDISIFQPRWSANGDLYYISDKTNWWNIYRYRDGKAENITPANAEFGYPQWVFGLSNYDFVEKGNKKYIVCTYCQNGKKYLATLDLESLELKNFDMPFNSYNYVQGYKNRAYFIGGSPTLANSLVELDIDSGKYKILKKSKDVSVEIEDISVAEFIEFPTENNKTAYGYFYPPKNKKYKLKKGCLPPLIVKSHGGPTAGARTSLDLETQYWTSRGFAVVDVDYGGSIGYGKEYRKRLEKMWGIVDVDDCVNAAKYLISKNLVDKDKLIIKGGSAGGYTTLCALTYRDVFAAGVSYFGVSDLEPFVEDTHKFESRYLDSLIGEYKTNREVYLTRSPIHYTDKLSCPVLLLQGNEDKIVPPSQSEKMFDALLKKKIPTAYILFENEQHGFRQSQTIKRAIEAEVYFYSKIFGLQMQEKIEPIDIANLND